MAFDNINAWQTEKGKYLKEHTIMLHGENTSLGFIKAVHQW